MHVNMNLYTDLEIDKINNLASKYFHFEDSKENFVKSPIITSSLILEKEHQKLSECLDFFNKGNVINICDIPSLEKIFTYIEKNGILDISQLLIIRNYLTNISTFKQAFGKKLEYKELSDIALDLIEFNSLKDSLYLAITNDLDISSSYSPLLQEIRSKLINMQSSFNSTIKQAKLKYKDYLALDEDVSKEGLPCLAIKSMYKNKVNGIISSISNTGNTSFIIPIEIINLQNSFLELKNKELEEINRIIEDFSKRIKNVLDSLKDDYKLALELDSIISRVSFGLSYKGIVSDISNHIELENLGILFIDKEKLVRNSFSLSPERKVLVISGPNAGGKTVLIRSICLACYMNQKGLLVDALKASLKVFSSLFFISGDNQSILDNLSTFSSHITLIDKCLKNVDENSLVIIDEIGQGTSPLDGEAIGIACIKYLIKKNCFAIITSHYDGIKRLSLEDKNVENGAMIFNGDTFKPTFKYKKGLIGKSYALEVSKNLGLDENIILEAKNYLKNNSQAINQQKLEKIDKLEQQLEKAKEELNYKNEELTRLINKRQDAINALEKEKLAIKEKAEQKIDSIVNLEVSKIEEAYKSKKISLKDMAELKGQLNNIDVSKKINVQKKKVKSSHVFAINDRVKVISFNNFGIIKDISLSSSKVKVEVEGLIINTTKDDLEYAPIALEDKKISKIDQFVQRKTGVKIECNLIGLREQEAKEKLDKYMDDVILARYHQVRIIHGFGSGILRKMVINYLSKNKNVESFRSGGETEGGLGATVVYLK